MQEEVGQWSKIFGLWWFCGSVVKCSHCSLFCLFLSPFSFVVMIWWFSLKHSIDRWFQTLWRSFDIAVIDISSWFVLMLQTKLVWELSQFPKTLQQMLPINTKPNCKMKWLRQTYLARDLHSMIVFKMLAHYILIGSALLCNSLHFHAHVLAPKPVLVLTVSLWKQEHVGACNTPSPG